MQRKKRYAEKFLTVTVVEMKTTLASTVVWKKHSSQYYKIIPKEGAYILGGRGENQADEEDTDVVVDCKESGPFSHEVTVAGGYAWHHFMYSETSEAIGNKVGRRAGRGSIIYFRCGNPLSIFSMQ